MILILDLADEHVEQLRELVDAAPLRVYGGLVVSLLPQLPLTEVGTGPLEPAQYELGGY